MYNYFVLLCNSILKIELSGSSINYFILIATVGFKYGYDLIIDYVMD
jgi:hypothetical protein